MKLNEQVDFQILEKALFEEACTVIELSSRISLSWGLYANIADKTTVDAILGTYSWNVSRHTESGMMRFYVNSSTTASLENSIAVLDQGTQVSGLDVMKSFLIVHSHCMEDAHARCDYSNSSG